MTIAAGKPPSRSTDGVGPPRRVSPPPDVDLGALKREVGGEVHLDAGTRALHAGTLILAEGFSCRWQILDRTGRRALHLA